MKSNIDVLVKEGLGSRGEEDFLLTRDTCLALHKLGGTKKVCILFIVLNQSIDREVKRNCS